ncbi:DUF4232 domain-containing protein [Streptomyces phyllanthi]|uniref:DUF4232 domain-containing protein n=1 Tax=Streptomyces phyllanthi TaxID=1803180 RepID=A0A5N8W9R7_9ACTN|nr:DUF4232 domain-containing protein [Streptomyces phyllanthi]MPY43862.1 DUF4232 domain-containing protein [Streptomyces phyllanthi]
MRMRSIAALSATATALLLTVPQSSAAGPHDVRQGVRPAAKTAVCARTSLSIGVRQSGNPTVVHISVTNQGSRACTVDRVPIVTFGNLDGSALPVPPGETGPRRIGAGETAYAAVRTIADRSDPEARSVDTITVSAHPDHFGRTITARRLGAGDAVLVWEPVTTWWKPSKAAADEALEDATG